MIPQLSSSLAQGSFFATRTSAADHAVAAAVSTYVSAQQCVTDTFESRRCLRCAAAYRHLQKGQGGTWWKQASACALRDSSGFLQPRPYTAFDSPAHVSMPGTISPHISTKVTNSPNTNCHASEIHLHGPAVRLANLSIEDPHSHLLLASRYVHHSWVGHAIFTRDGHPADTDRFACYVQAEEMICGHFRTKHFCLTGARCYKPMKYTMHCSEYTWRVLIYRRCGSLLHARRVLSTARPCV